MNFFPVHVFVAELLQYSLLILAPGPSFMSIYDIANSWYHYI